MLSNPAPASLPERVTVSPEVLYQEVEGQAVLLHLERERYYSLDAVGTRIWGMLTNRSDTSAIRETMLALYDVDESTLTSDLARFIGRLADAGLVIVDA
ncbi:MAG TPA: PqqD family protein [Gemmatimonadaceae bacterium]|nr:PqqD family protein [Gemmatimonadaceae bacterium]